MGHRDKPRREHRDRREEGLRAPADPVVAAAATLDQALPRTDHRDVPLLADRHALPVAGAPGRRRGRRRPDPAPRHRDAVAADRADARPRRRRGGLLLLPPTGDGQGRHRHRVRHPARPVRPRATPAGVLPRPVALRPTALPADHRPVDPAPLRRVRLRVPDREHDDHADRDRTADPHQRAARAVRADRDGAAGALDPALRTALRPAGPSGAGPHRRPRHLRRGVRARHPGHQVLRSPPAHAEQLLPRRRAPARGGAFEDPHAGVVLGAARGHAAADPRRRGLGRGGCGRPRVDDPRRSWSRSSRCTCS